MMFPYRTMGPASSEESERQRERYDKQLKEKVGIDPEGLSTLTKITALRKFREREYEKLKDAVYKRRGWSPNGVPTLDKVRTLGIDFPIVIELVEKHS